MSKYIILQHWTGELGEFEKLSIENMKAYAKFCGAEYRLLRGSVFMDGLDPQLQRLHMLEEEFDDYDITLMLDCDMFTHKDLKENIFADVSGVSVNTSYNMMPIFSTAMRKYANQDYTYWYGCIWRLEKDIRVRLRKHLRNMTYEELSKFQPGFHDEGVMHYLASLEGIKNQDLPDGFKWAFPSDRKRLHRRKIEDAAFIHIRNYAEYMSNKKVDKLITHKNLQEKGIL